MTLIPAAVGKISLHHLILSGSLAHEERSQNAPSAQHLIEAILRGQKKYSRDNKSEPAIILVAPGGSPLTYIRELKDNLKAALSIVE